MGRAARWLRDLIYASPSLDHEIESCSYQQRPKKVKIVRPKSYSWAFCMISCKISTCFCPGVFLLQNSKNTT